MKANKLVKNIGMTLLLPVATYLFFFILTRITGNTTFGVGLDLQTIIYTSVYSCLISQALSLNLQTGRFDFAIGSTLVLSTIIGGDLAYKWGLGAFGMLACVTLLAAICGLVSGLVYVILGLPPMVVSLGIAMIYEAIGFMYNNAKGLRLIGKMDYLIFSKFPNNIILMIIVLILLVIVYDYSKIGYNRRALAGGQKIAVDVGIREKKNAVYCYVIAGALLGLAGCVYLSKYGMISPETGLSSSSYFMSAFLPMFIGSIFGRYSSQPIAVFMGAVVQAFLTSGLSALGASSSVMTVINGLVVCVFLIYSSNSYKLVEAKMFKEKMEKANMARGIAAKANQN